MKIAEVTRGLDHGGAEHALVARLAASSRGAIEYVVINTMPEAAALERRLLDIDVPVISLTSTGEAKRVSELLRLIQVARADVLNCHAPSITIPLKLAVRANRLPVSLVETIHSVRYRRNIVNFAAALTAWMPDRTIFVGDHLRDSLVHRFARNTETIPLGVDVDTIRRTTSAARQRTRHTYGFLNSDVVLGIVARFSPEKNHSILAALVERHAQRLRESNLRILAVGDGETYHSFRDRILACGADDVVLTPGALEEGWRALAACDGALLVSDYEGLPVFFMEALAAGVPLLAPRVGGIPGILLPGENGIFLDISNIEALASAICAYARNPYVRSKLREGALLSADSWNVKNSVIRHERLYGELYGGLCLG